MKLKTLLGTAENTAVGPILYVLGEDNKVIDGVSGGAIGHLDRYMGKWALFIGQNQGPHHASRRRAVERGLVEMLGYIL